MGRRMGCRMWCLMGSQIGSRIWSQIITRIGYRIGSRIRSRIGYRIESRWGSRIGSRIGSWVGSRALGRISGRIAQLKGSNVAKEEDLGVSKDVGRLPPRLICRLPDSCLARGRHHRSEAGCHHHIVVIIIVIRMRRPKVLSGRRGSKHIIDRQKLQQVFLAAIHTEHKTDFKFDVFIVKIFDCWCGITSLWYLQCAFSRRGALCVRKMGMRIGRVQIIQAATDGLTPPSGSGMAAHTLPASQVS